VRDRVHKAKARTHVAPFVGLTLSASLGVPTVDETATFRSIVWYGARGNAGVTDGQDRIGRAESEFPLSSPQSTHGAGFRAAGAGMDKRMSRAAR